MAGFRDNLQHLRATRNMTQSHLAMLVGVSRQSVAKWEAETSYPEMDKLIKIVDIFDCTIDDLVRGDLTKLAPAPALSVPKGTPPADICGYDEHMRKRAWRVPFGFALIIFGLGAGNLIEALELAAGIQPVVFGFATFLIGIVAGLALLVPARMEHRSFMREHPYIEDFYTRAERDSARKFEGWGIVVGAAVLLSSMVIPLFVGFVGLGQSLASFAWWTCVSVGVLILIHSVLTGRRTEIARYNNHRNGRCGRVDSEYEPDKGEVHDD